ncbi:MAG: hypothetical protein JNM00_15195, partial [Flavobacteriales bacterium]|nr:hypothetical protein [Flavobacteriales bacterium]
MKTIRLFLLGVFLLQALLVVAQVPQAFSYQGVARNNSGALLSNTSIVVEVRIHNTTINGPVVFSESHAVATNSYGGFGIAIGQGTPIIGNFVSLDWVNGNKFVETLVDFGTGLQSIGTTQFLSVPYSLASREVTDAQLNDLTDVNTTGVSVGQLLKWNGSEWIPGTDQQTTYVPGSGISIASNTISNTGDINAGDDLLLTTNHGGDVSGVYNNLQLAANSVGSSEIANGAVGTSELSQMGASNDQVLKWNGSQWAPAAISVATGWGLEGNAGTNPADDFLGTTDNQRLIFRTNNSFSGSIDPDYPYCTSLGYQSLISNIGGTENVAFGSGAMYSNLTGSFNTAIGALALVTNSSGSDNTAVGHLSLSGNMDGHFNTAVGRYALAGNQSGNGNVAIGDQAMLAGSGYTNIAIGSHALAHSTGDNNIAIGYAALDQNN